MFYPDLTRALYRRSATPPGSPVVKRLALEHFHTAHAVSLWGYAVGAWGKSVLWRNVRRSRPNI